MQNAKNANIVMSFNLGSDFTNRFFMVAEVIMPSRFNVENFLRTLKSAGIYDAVSIDVVSSIGLQMGGVGYYAPGPTPITNLYQFGKFQISQGILMQKPSGWGYMDYFQLLDETMKKYGDIGNFIWFFHKESLEAYLQSQSAMYHQVLFDQSDVGHPAWFERQEPLTNQTQHQPNEYHTPMSSGPLYGGSAFDNWNGNKGGN